ncbi:hypothetical protein BC567DRAFT_218666 [Phyllosticta citribraziliensis]
MPRRSRLYPSQLRLLSWFILLLSEYQVSFFMAHGWPLLLPRPCEMRLTLVQCLFGQDQETNTTRPFCNDNRTALRQLKKQHSMRCSFPRDMSWTEESGDNGPSLRLRAAQSTQQSASSTKFGNYPLTWGPLLQSPKG